MTQSFRPAILYIDDENANLIVFKKAFESEFLVKTCSSAQEALEILKTEHFPLVISDQRMPGMTGIELCEKLVSESPQSMRMILTAYTETQMLLDAINKGHVHDYIVKPWKKSDLKPVLDRAFESYKQRVVKIRELESRARQSDVLQEDLKSVFDEKSLVGSSTGLKHVMGMIQKAAPTDSTIMVYGETGTGKELVARTIHEHSSRKNGPFVAVHCAALAKTILESELFGHEKGAFTGADQQRKGRFESADGGTVFLDEIGEISEDVQVKLLRVLQEKQVQRVGGNQTIKVDVRIVTATNKNLAQMVKDGIFREDLYYRLNVIPVTVPSLRDRISDLPVLADFFLKKFNKQLGKNLIFSKESMDHLCKYDWPGNVRELQNILERTVILSSGPEIEVEDLKLNVDEALKVEKVNVASSPQNVRHEIQKKEVEKLTEALKTANGNLSEAARALGIARSTLFDRLKKYKLI
ncbi:MAG: sigma-54-dependent Fis family transcriptional regulator [Proteobacteria bacterium]|nr:sigma-54-dependent Fis family transcriptional regulator [Pseudomonadota bacterium]